MYGYLKVESRKNSNLREIRSQGFVPAIICGSDESVQIQLKEVDLRKVVEKTGKVMEVDVDGKKHFANLDEVQKDPVTRKLVHVSFHALKKGQSMVMELPIVLDGQAVGLKEGGILVQAMKTIHVEGLPSKMPEAVHVDVSALELGNSLHVSDCPPPAGLKWLDKELDRSIVNCTLPKAEPVVIEGEAEGEEGAAEEGAAEASSEAVPESGSEEKKGEESA